MSRPEPEGRVLRPLLFAFAFLTRLPLPHLTPRGRELGQATAAYPLVGLTLGGALLGLGLLLDGHVSVLLQATLLLSTLAVVTGGLHLDGVADCFDALGVFGDRERRLAVMKDPRSGALGVAALIFAILLKVLALSEASLWVLPTALALSRWLAAALAVAFPYARERGTGGAVSTQATWRELALGGLLVLGALWVTGPLAWAGAVGGATAGLALAWKMNRTLGGLTGDVYGASVEASEIGFLLTVAVLID